MRPQLFAGRGPVIGLVFVLFDGHELALIMPRPAASTQRGTNRDPRGIDTRIAVPAEQRQRPQQRDQRLLNDVIEVRVLAAHDRSHRRGHVVRQSFEQPSLGRLVASARGDSQHHDRIDWHCAFPLAVARSCEWKTKKVRVGHDGSRWPHASSAGTRHAPQGEKIVRQRSDMVLPGWASPARRHNAVSP